MNAFAGQQAKGPLKTGASLKLFIKSTELLERAPIGIKG
jgi:hypothetical protein